MIEEWKDILGYEGKYQVSNTGRVQSLKHNDVKILRLSKNKGGYLLVGLGLNGIHSTKYVHRLVWEAFNGPIPEGMQVNHINEDKTDNRLENLNLMTCKENLNWGTTQERKGASYRKKNYHLSEERKKQISKANMGNQHVKGNQFWKNWSGSTLYEKPVLQYTVDGEFIKEYQSCCLAARETGCDHSNIIKCCKGKQKTCGYRDKKTKKIIRFIWKYK